MGGDRLKVYRITDFMTPLVILENPKIAKDIHEDDLHQPFPNVVDEFWIGLSVSGYTFACFRVHQLSRHVWQVHAYVLPNYRQKYAFEAAKLAKQWAWENIPMLKTLITIVPACHPNVRGFVTRMGFEFVGKLEKSYTKNGKLEDILIFSIQE